MKKTPPKKKTSASRTRKHPITAKFVEDLPVSVLADIAEVLGGHLHFALLPRELNIVPSGAARLDQVTMRDPVVITPRRGPYPR